MNLKVNKNYKKNNLILCSFFPVGLEDYQNYFIENFDDFVYLHWKFPHSKGNLKSALIKYKKNEKIAENFLFSLPAISNNFFYFLCLALNYLVYFFQAIFLFWRRDSKQARVFFGINYFCTFCGVVLKKLGRVDFVIYRVMDFFPLPPSGPYRFLNRIFYVVDKFCLRNADSIWFTTEGHIAGREKYGYFDRNKHKHDYRIIPLGLDVDKFISRPITDQNKHSIVYCGVISKYHLLDLLFNVVSELKKDFKNIKLNLIGSGPDEEFFKDLAKRMKLEDNVIFHGFMKEDKCFRSLMQENILGIALYKDEENFMKYTEPAKVKYYLSFGIPAVVSNVPTIARELDSKKVCFAVKNNKSEIVKIIKNFIQNYRLQKEYKNNIKEFIKIIDIDKLLDSNFQKVFANKNK